MTMRIGIRLALLVVAVAIAAWIWWPQRGADVGFRQGDIVVTAPWARATPGALKIGAAYMTLANRGAAPDRLIGVRSDVAERVELHTNLNQDGMMQMRPLDSVALPPGQAVRFEPSGLHLMLVNLKAPLQEGSEFPLQVTFERAGTLTVQVKVGAIGAADSPANTAHHHH
jgi:periplasmic copper chaperone A